jgi:hypothetical protein
VGSVMARTSLECVSGVFMAGRLCAEVLLGNWSIVNMFPIRDSLYVRYRTDVVEFFIQGGTASNERDAIHLPNLPQVS